MGTPLDIGLAAAGIAISIPDLVGSCLTLGRTILDHFHDIRDADTIAKELAAKFTLQWGTMELLLTNLDRIAKCLSLEPQLVTEFENLLTILQNRLVNAMPKASKMKLWTPSNPETRTIGFKSGVAWGKADLENMLSAAKEWEEMVSKRLYLIDFLRVLDRAPEEQRWEGNIPRLNSAYHSQSSIVAQSTEYQTVEVVKMNLDPKSFSREIVEFSALSYLRNVEPEEHSYLVESHIWDEHQLREVSAFEERVYETARMLKNAEPSLMSILPCPGIVELQKENSREIGFELLYQVEPHLSEPRSLRDLLLDKRNKEIGIMHPLDHRIRLAHNLATAVLYVHSGRFVHKRIKPENIILFSKGSKERFPQGIGDPFLVGFERSRPELGISAKRGESDIVARIYQHPERWNVYAESRFYMRHDVYSLGVVLLEIGLWSSFVRWSKSRQKWVLWGLEIDDIISKDGEFKEDKGAIDLQERLMEKARKLLPPRLGKRYTDIVVACLSGRFEEGVDEEMEDRAREGLGYIKNIVTKLEKLKGFFEY